ncbi:MAG: hypothetical protein HXY44_15730, partial [Syntrophaceae bacterium]|nr:hypothetical protein [Syntrophaceae bacterium]
QSVSSLAKEMGISDVGLAKICKRHNIPRPGLGYWAKKQAGIKVQQKPLPKGNDERFIEIIGHSSDNEDVNKKKTSFRISKSLKRQLRSIVDAATLTDPHPLVKQTAEILQSHQPNKNGLLEPYRRHSLNIEVSPKSLDRALRIMDALIKTFETMGGSVFLKGNSTFVSINGANVDIGIKEELARKRRDPKDHNLDGYYEFEFSRYAERGIPSGRLYLTIEDAGFGYSNGNCRQHWRDSESKHLEERVGNFIIGILKAAAHKRTQSHPAPSTAASSPANSQESKD